MWFYEFGVSDTMNLATKYKKKGFALHLYVAAHVIGCTLLRVFIESILNLLFLKHATLCSIHVLDLVFMHIYTCV